jgi:hypothetical protein
VDQSIQEGPVRTDVLLHLASVSIMAAAACSTGDQLVDEESTEDPAGEELGEDADGEASRWLEFLERVVPGARPGTYIVEGDLRIHGEQALREYYERNLRDRRANVSHIGSTDNIWPITRKLRLTYCVSDDFGGDHDQVASKLQIAAMDWERATDVNFIHLSGYDGDCDPERLPDDVLFAVIKSGGSYLASAFFPNAPPEERYLDVTGDGLDQSSDDLTGTLRHELGHILGLRHEHIRNPIDCTEETTGSGGLGSRDLSPYDGASIMHYDWCPGGTSNGVNLSRYDVIAIKNLYSLPRDRWLARLAGYWHETDYDANAIKDIFWLMEYSATELWLGNPAPDLFKAYANPVFMNGRKPIPGLFDDFRTDFLDYAQGPGVDWLVRSVDGTTFTSTAMTIEGTFQPLVGNFDHNGTTDILWYRPGTHMDYLWRAVGGGQGTISFTSSELTINGYYHPIVLDYNDDGLSDVLWYDPYTSSSPLWTGVGNGMFAGGAVNVTGNGVAASGQPYQAIVGQFNNDGNADILWYGAGDAPDVLWLGSAASPAGSVIGLSIKGTYKPFAGNFDGGGSDDVFWYNPGTGGDALWTFNDDASHGETTLDVDGDYAPVIGDFDGDFDSDILWYTPEVGGGILWTATGGGRFADGGRWTAPRAAYPVGYGLTY